MRYSVLLALLASAAYAQTTDSTVRPPGKAATQAQAVQGVPGGIRIPVDATFGGTVTTSCHATAAAPTYVEGTDNSLSCDLAGSTRTTGGGGGGAFDVTIHDPTVTTQKLGINISGQAAVQNPPNLDAALSSRATEATLALIKAKTDNLDALLSTRTKPADTQAVSAASLPLPTGAATENTLAGIKTGTDKIPASPSTDRTTALAPFSTRLSDGAAFYKATTPADTQPVSAASLPLPAGAATEATLATVLLNSTFTGRINTQGQKAMAASTPVVIASDQSAVPVSGPLTDTQLRATAVPVSGPLTDTQLRASAVPVSVTSTVVPTGLASLTTNQIAVTASAQQLPSNSAKVVCITVLDGGSQNVKFGASGVTTGTGSELVPGGTACRPLDNTNRIFVIASGTGSTLAWEAYN